MTAQSTDPTREEIDSLVKQTPPSGARRSVGFVAVVATLGSLLFGYDTGVISGALPYMYLPQAANGLHLNSTEEGLVGGILLIGCACGAFFGGRLSDAYGRRHNILMLAAIFLFGALGCTFSPNIWVLYAARFILGLAVGGASATVPVYLAETAPKSIRGTLVGIDQLMIVTGQFLAFAVNAGIARITGGPEATVTSVAPGTTIKIDGVEQAVEVGRTYSWDVLKSVQDAIAVDGGTGNTWRYMLVVCSIPAIALWLGMRMMPESSRWHASQARYIQAIAELKRVRRPDDDIAAEIDEMIEINRREASAERWSLSRCFQIRWTRKLLIIGVLVGVFNQTTGVNTMMYYAPKILQNAGFGTESAITLTVLTGIASVIGSSLGLWLLLRFSRRGVLLGGTIGLTVMLWVMTAVFLFGINPHLDDAGNILNTMPAMVPYLVVVVIVVYMLFMQGGNAPGTWVIMSELFPTRMRGAAMGFAVLCLWVVNAIITFLFPIMMDKLGPVITYLTFSIINVIAVIYMHRNVPETKYSSLEELEEEFQQRYA
ncbi:MFS transporter [Actinomyces oricola]|uniref:MFS transporter n=1 Tax=Actinomyces oricola TaxID=206043 RepID=UPI000FFF0502|nr:MFS transporter [Actinomyces oricola]